MSHWKTLSHSAYNNFVPCAILKQCAWRPLVLPTPVCVSFGRPRAFSRMFGPPACHSRNWKVRLTGNVLCQRGQTWNFQNNVSYDIIFSFRAAESSIVDWQPGTFELRSVCAVLLNQRMSQLDGQSFFNILVVTPTKMKKYVVTPTVVGIC